MSNLPSRRKLLSQRKPLQRRPLHHHRSRARKATVDPVQKKVEAQGQVGQVPDLPRLQAVIAALAPPAATEATEVRAQKAAVVVNEAVNAEANAVKAAVPTSAAVDDPSTAPSISSWRN
jgi:hypothetical protein